MFSANQSDENTHESGGGRWWLLIGVLAVRIPVVVGCFLTLFLLGIFTGVQSPASQNLVMLPYSLNRLPWFLVTGVSLVLVWLLPPLAGMTLYFDRDYVASASEWLPSFIYYFMAVPVPVLSDVIAIYYLYERHIHIGTP